MRFELNAFLAEELVAARDEQFDMRGADEPRVVDVVGQPLADAISVYVEGRVTDRCLLGSAARSEADN